jgi:para-nitrobenzyl esterase
MTNISPACRVSVTFLTASGSFVMKIYSPNLYLFSVFIALLPTVVVAQKTPADFPSGNWQVVRFQSSDDKILTPSDPSKYTIGFEAGGVALLREDCNRGRGLWKSDGKSQLTFGAFALTRAFCPSEPLNQRFAKDMGNVRSYVLKNGHLFLSLVADGGTYEFAPLK